MSRFFPQRQPHLVEEMDRPDCNPVLLKNTYEQFSKINRLLSQWERVYKKELRPLMQEKRTYSLLDIGFGGGDISLKLSKWARKDGLNLQVTGIEIDERAYDYARELQHNESVNFRFCSSSELVNEEAQFDFVISNHVLHHLKNSDVLSILNEAKQLAGQKVIFNDIERSGLGYVLFNIFSRMIFRKSYITVDGLTSIKRSFTFPELKQLAPAGWLVKRMFPFRLLLIYDKNR